jgi:peroxiredoxin
MPSAFGGQSQQRWGDNTINAQEYMRDLQLSDLSGKPCHTGQARGKGWLLLVFFDTTSPASLELMPYIQKIADAYKESGKLTVWGISQNNEAETRAFADANGIKIPLLVDYDRYAAMVYGLTTVPTLYLANNAGIVQRKSAGFHPNALNDVSAKVATFAEVEPVVIVEGAPMPAPAAPAAPPVAAAV